jgi:hypothetical protein
MNFGTFHGVNAHLYVPGKNAEVTYEGQKLPATIVRHDGRHGVDVKLDSPVLKVTVTVIKRLFRKDLEEKKVEMIEDLHLFETNVKPL